ncbi:hypothetical protein RN22_07850 [Grimontia sp. AD028]|uniref:hypothetical protein n=1 Tax=Grimontia sp. AD028 TaxID=1581149 RepID=UPI00061ADCFD|nr:hypothetical protein [Grimontia sp. AD028]KKD61061.1 hypothetical protein RN22_07850 [Grimontia sp. AD028]
MFRLFLFTITLLILPLTAFATTCLDEGTPISGIELVPQIGTDITNSGEDEPCRIECGPDICDDTGCLPNCWLVCKFRPALEDDFALGGSGGGICPGVLNPIDEIIYPIFDDISRDSIMQVVK